MLDYHGHGEAAGLAAAADGWSRPRLRQIGGCGEAERGQPAPTPHRLGLSQIKPLHTAWLFINLSTYQLFPYHALIDKAQRAMFIFSLLI